MISPFKILLIDMILAMVAAFFLMALGGKASGVLWGFTVLLGLSFATINGATVSWASQHLPGKTKSWENPDFDIIALHKETIHQILKFATGANKTNC